jgi:cytochrome c peroxidase
MTPLLFGLALLSASVLLSAPPLAAAVDDALIRQANQFFRPLPDRLADPAENPATPEKVALGKMLFYEPRLSKSGAISCNSCHNLATFGVDNLAGSVGHLGAIGGRNAPTVLNSGLFFVQFWDGRAATLEDQAKGPILNPIEMAAPDAEFVLARLRTMPDYVAAFKRAFPGEPNPITYDNIAKAIAAFERMLITPARFDRFLKGDAAALAEREKQGLRLVIAKGCITCHNGVGAGGASFQKFGIANRYESSDDAGRYALTKNESDRFVFKVPTWRNVTRTAPYFHDGAVWDLKEAIRIMAWTQFGQKLTDDEIDAMAAFMQSLEGEIPRDALTLPVLPASTPATPRPVLK